MIFWLSVCCRRVGPDGRKPPAADDHRETFNSLPTMVTGEGEGGRSADSQIKQIGERVTEAVAQGVGTRRDHPQAGWRLEQRAGESAPGYIRAKSAFASSYPSRQPYERKRRASRPVENSAAPPQQASAHVSAPVPAVTPLRGPRRPARPGGSSHIGPPLAPARIWNPTIETLRRDGLAIGRGARIPVASFSVGLPWRRRDR